jgi:hypothetical protein
MITNTHTVPVRATSHYIKRATPPKITCIIPTSTRRISTNMNPIDAAIEVIESREAGAAFSYHKVANRFGVDCTTLLQRHQGASRSWAATSQQQQLLNPQQEEELVRYIERCTEQSLPPTREMVQNFASAVAKWNASDVWVTRFLHCLSRDGNQEGKYQTML